MKRSQPTVHTQQQHTVRRVSIDSSEIFLACCVKLNEIFIALRTLAFSSHFPHVAFRSYPRRRFLMQTLFRIVLGNPAARNLTSQCREQNQQPTECFGVNATSHPDHPSERIRHGSSQQIEVLHLWRGHRWQCHEPHRFRNVHIARESHEEVGENGRRRFLRYRQWGRQDLPALSDSFQHHGQVRVRSGERSLAIARIHQQKVCDRRGRAASKDAKVEQRQSQHQSVAKQLRRFAVEHR